MVLGTQRGGVEGVYCRAAVELYSYTALYSAVQCCIDAVSKQGRDAMLVCCIALYSSLFAVENAV